MITEKIKEIIALDIDVARKELLDPVVQYVQRSIKKSGKAQLNFVCTHNSRRSQFSQVWAQVAANYYQIPVSCFSSGVEVTACNERTIASLSRFGFEIKKTGNQNPKYEIFAQKDNASILCFSKLLEDDPNPKDNFGAIMTCSDADENCPLILGAEERIPLRYEDPKVFDDTPLEAEKYDERSLQIASEMFYIFKNCQQ